MSVRKELVEKPVFVCDVDGCSNYGQRKCLICRQDICESHAVWMSTIYSGHLCPRCLEVGQPLIKQIAAKRAEFDEAVSAAFTKWKAAVGIS